MNTKQSSAFGGIVNVAMARSISLTVVAGTLATVMLGSCGDGGTGTEAGTVSAAFRVDQAAEMRRVDETLAV